MKKSKLFMTLFLAGSLMSTSLTGCGNGTANNGDTTAAPAGSDTTAQASGDTTAASDTTAEAKTGGQTANLLMDAEPGSLDASKSTDLYCSMVLQNTMVALTKPVFENGVEVPREDGAEKIEVSEDGLVWTFHLRDMKWADGEPLKAQDYVYGLMRTLDPNTASQYAFLLDPIKGAHEYNTADPGDAAAFEEAKKNVAIVAKDDKTLEITLKGPCAYFKQTTYFKIFMPQRQDFVEKQGTTYGADADKLLCCGPYILKEWKHNDTMVLEKNNDYWDAASYPLETVNLRIIKDTETAYAEFEAGNVDAIGGVSKPEWYDKFKDRDDLTNIKKARADVVYMGFNESAEHNSIMKNLKLRQAVSAALNREEAVQELYGGLTGTPAYDWCHDAFNLEPNLNYRTVAGTPPIKTLQEKVPDPKAHLIEGMKELGLGEDPSQLEIKVYTSSGNNAFPEYFQANLQEVLGCKIALDISDWAQFLTKRDNYEHDVSMQAWSADYNDPMTMFDLFKTGTGQSGTGMANAQYDDLVNQAGALPAEKNEERIKLFSQAENILLIDECAVSPWAHRQRNGFRYNYLENYEPSIFGALNLRGLSIKGK